MKNRSGIIFSVLLSLFLVFAGLDNAEARRFGGGGNFGGRSSYSAPYQRSAQPQRQTQQQQAGKQAPAANPGMAGRGMMGMLGALAVGGLLGSMFSGGGFHGLNFLDILVFGAIAFFLYKMFAGRKSPAQQPAYGRTSHDDHYPEGTTSNNPTNQGGFNTDVLFKDKPSASQPEQNYQQDADFNTVAVPNGFDEKGFLDGAKIAYKALQKAWDARDLAEIRGLTTDKVFAEIQDQINASTEENHTDVLKVEAELLEVREIGNEIEAVVLFDAVMREDREAQAGQVREVWHFIKPNNPNQTKWLLDGIQQLAE